MSAVSPLHHQELTSSVRPATSEKCQRQTSPLVPNRLLSSFQRHNSSLHCFSYADALHERQRAWRGTEMSKTFKEDLPWLGSSCSLLACAKSPGRSASNTRKDSRACYPRSAQSPPGWPVLDASA